MFADFLLNHWISVEENIPGWSKEVDVPSAIEDQWAWENLHSLETPWKSPFCSAGNSFKNSNLLASSLPWIYEHIGLQKKTAAYPRLLHGSSGRGWILPRKFGGSLKFKDGQVHLDLGKHLDGVNLPHQTLAKRYVPSSSRDTMFEKIDGTCWKITNSMKLLSGTQTGMTENSRTQ